MPDASNDRDANQTSDRRDFLGRASAAAMAAGLVGGYGAFGAVATRYLYPARPDAGSWQFVTNLGRLAVGDSLRYQTPGGETVNITRRAQDGIAEDFMAMSSVCPHLGCQVHWEEANQRYFCPCHNGVFDAQGVGTEGPPGDAGQSLPRYPLRVEGNLLFIQVPTVRLVADGETPRGRVVDDADCASAPGHDPCLSPLARGPRNEELG